MEKSLNILITGSNGFIGKNLVSTLKFLGYTNLQLFDVDTPMNQLDAFLKETHFVFHLAGVNRPKDPSEFMLGNFGLTSNILETLKKYQNKAPIVLSSSIQAVLKNPYGESKKAGEDLLIEYGQTYQVPVMIYRFPNVFGKWSKPFYNSAVATFCHQLAHHLPITIHDPKASLPLVYIDDVVQELIRALEGHPHLQDGFGVVEPSYGSTVGEVAAILETCAKVRETRILPDLSNPLIAKLYATYTSFLPKDHFAYTLQSHHDPRGSFTEFLRFEGAGQISVNVSKPGIEKGHHWHHTKHEKFLVVSGEALIRFRSLHETEVMEYRVQGKELKVVDIPPGYVHSIVNIGTTDLVTLMWASEHFDESKPDTMPEKVK